MLILCASILVLGTMALVWALAGPGVDVNPVTGAYEPGYARKRWNQ